MPSSEALDNNDHSNNKQVHDREIVQEQGVGAMDDSKQVFGVGNVQAMHCNELFECHSVEEGVDVTEFVEDYVARDAKLHESGLVKDKDKTLINSKVAVSKAIASLVKNISSNINVDPSDLNVVSTTQSLSCQDSSSFDTFNLSPSN